MAPSSNLAAVAVGSFVAGAAAFALAGKAKKLCALFEGRPNEEEKPREGRVPIFVMMPLDTITEDGKHVKDKEQRIRWLTGLKDSGAKGVMVDVWWGLCEKQPGQYDFQGYLELCEILKTLGLKLQAVMSFHQCGGNVGDSVTIPIPSYALDVAKAQGLLYRDHEGKVSEDCLSLSADQESVFQGKGSSKRDAITCYKDRKPSLSKARMMPMMLLALTWREAPRDLQAVEAVAHCLVPMTR
jgi:beta-amylase